MPYKLITGIHLPWGHGVA